MARVLPPTFVRRPLETEVPRRAVRFRRVPGIRRNGALRVERVAHWGDAFRRPGGGRIPQSRVSSKELSLPESK